MKKPYYSVGFEEFCELATQGNLIPLYREIFADYETPVSAFSKINSGPTAYLFESIEGGENWARYSFLGNHAKLVVWEQDNEIIIKEGKHVSRLPMESNPLAHIEQVLAPYHPVAVPGLPRFLGGAVGYLGYDVVRSFEPIPEVPKDDTKLPKLAFLLTDTLVIFDNIAHTIKVVANAHITTHSKTALKRAYVEAKSRIDEMIDRLKNVRLVQSLKIADLLCDLGPI